MDAKITELLTDILSVEEHHGHRVPIYPPDFARNSTWEEGELRNLLNQLISMRALNDVHFDQQDTSQIWWFGGLSEEGRRLAREQ